MPRSLGGLAAHLLKEDLQYYEYLKMVWGGSIGTLRWTTYPAKAILHTLTQTINIDGSSQAWEQRPFQPGDFQQLQDASISISSLWFGNADLSFSDLEQQRPGGVRGVTTTVYLGFYPKATVVPKASDLVAKFVLYDGELDRGESGNEYRCSLEPFASPLSVTFPRRRFSSVFGFNFIPKADLVVDTGNGTFRPPAPSPSQTGEGGGGGITTPGDIGSGGRNSGLRPRPAPRAIPPRSTSGSGGDGSGNPRHSRTVTR